MEYTSPGQLSIPNILSAVVTLLFVVVTTGHPNHGEFAEHHKHYTHKEARALTSADTYRDFEDYDYDETAADFQPEFLDTETNISAVEGRMATLPCSVRYLGTRQVTWNTVVNGNTSHLTIGDYVWTRDRPERLSVSFGGVTGQMVTQWNLQIKSVALSDAGIYQCRITDKVPLWRDVYLTVKPRPPPRPVVNVTGTQFVDKGEKIKLRCNATGGPQVPEGVDWFKDGTKLDTSSLRGAFNTYHQYMRVDYGILISDLVIEHAEESDSGEYICRSSDRKIDSIKVTVLIAETTNRKRDSKSRTGETNERLYVGEDGDNDDGVYGENDSEDAANLHQATVMLTISMSLVSLLAWCSDRRIWS